MFSVVIPNYNGQEFLFGCLNSILSASGSLAAEIIVVDNGSTDGSVGYLKSQSSKVKSTSQKLKVIFNKKNLGFAKAVNQGILAAKNEFVALINNDLKIERNWFAEIEKAIRVRQRKKRIATYCGKVLNWDGTKIESAGLFYWLKGKAFNRGNDQSIKTDHYRKEEFVFGAPASAVVYCKPAIVEAGLFDEDFFAYEEDVDLALRLANNRWKTLYLPGAISYHLGGGTSKKMGSFRQRMDFKNWWFIIIKNYPLSVIIKNGPAILIERARNLSGLIKAVVWCQVPSAVLSVFGELLIKLPKIIGKRKPVNKEILFQDSENRGPPAGGELKANQTVFYP